MLLKAHGKSLRGLFGSERFLPVWINNPDSIANGKVTFGLHACTLICKCWRLLWFSMLKVNHKRQLCCPTFKYSSKSLNSFICKLLSYMPHKTAIQDNSGNILLSLSKGFSLGECNLVAYLCAKFRAFRPWNTLEADKLLEYNSYGQMCCFSWCHLLSSKLINCPS